MRIDIYNCNQEETEVFRRELKEHTLRIFRNSFKKAKEEGNVSGEAELVVITSESVLDVSDLDRMPFLKAVITRSTGYDNLPVEECKKRGILALHIPGYATESVAEHTIGLMLGVVRSEKFWFEKKEWDRLKGKKGTELKGKVLGVVGFGRIGSRVAEIGKCLGMKVLVNDIRDLRVKAEEMGVEFASLNEILQRSNIVTLHCSYNETSHHLINQSNIFMMNKGSVLINTSRGAVIENSALLKALDSGRIKAAVDVIEGEDCLLEGKRNVVVEKLLKHRNLIWTPHIGAFTEDARSMLIMETIRAVRSIAKRGDLDSYLCD
ncbi:hypothetical protein D6764_02805 [Candidatus Woesearchaeota archaeon]|nr:MAG: hypothetical protein D6764_02805 [Candidatus Woesearchaeota archaeon]